MKGMRGIHIANNPAAEHVVTLTDHGWHCTCGSGVGGLDVRFNADRLLRDGSAEMHAHEFAGRINMGGAK